MLPLIPLAISLVPELVRLISGDKAGAVASTISNVVAGVTGTTDPEAAKQKIAQDPAIAANLRIRLAEIALDAQKTQNAADEQKRQAELETLRTSVQNTSNARATMLGLTQAHTWVSAAPAVVSAVVTVGFFAFIIILVFHGLAANEVSAQIINIAVGALTAGFATVINFWLGSSQGSRDKDIAVQGLQSAQADQTRDAIQSLKSVATTLVSNPPPQAAPQPAAAGPSPGATAVPISEPVIPAPDNLIREVMPNLEMAHRYFPNGVSWALETDGISVDGATPRGTAGDPATVTRIWSRYGDLCSSAAKHYGVPVELVVATIATESGGNPNARRQEPKISDESVGLMQTLVNTARGVLGRPSLRGDELLDPALSITAGTAYIAQQRGGTHFDPPLVAAAYNAGSLRRDDGEANRWRLLCYPTGTGQYIDNYIAWFNDSMRVSKEQQWGRQGVPSFASLFPAPVMAAAA